MMKNQLETTLLTALCLLGGVLTAQEAREATQLDQAAASFAPDGEQSALAHEGRTRIVVWADERAGPDQFDLFLALSTDDGLSWSAERRVTDAQQSSRSAIEPVLALENGAIHLLCREETGPQKSELVYRRSTDGGQTWSSQILVQDPLEADMSVAAGHVVIVWREQASTQVLRSRWSSDGGQSFGAAIPIDSLNETLYDALAFDLQVDSGVAHLVFHYDLPGDRDLWYAEAHGASTSWASLQRIDQAAIGEGAPVEEPHIEVAAGRLHVAWAETGRQGAGSNPSVYYRYSDDLGASWESERRVGQYPHGTSSAQFIQIDAEADLVAMVWGDLRSGARRAYVVVSRDGGTSLEPDRLMPMTGAGTKALQWDIAVEGRQIAVGTVEQGLNNDSLPALILSADAGQSWTAAIPLDASLPAGQGVSMSPEGLQFAGGSILACWDEQGTTRPAAMRVSGLRLPVIHFQKTGSNKAVLSMSLVDEAQVGQLARWAASLSPKESVHPENPGLFLQLGPGGVYNQSLAKAAALTKTVAADGTAQTGAIPLKPSLMGKTLYFQGWVRVNGIGQAPSDVLAVSL